MVNRVRLVFVGMLCASAVIPTVAEAQSLPAFVTVTTFQVQPDMRRQFEVLQQEANAARRDAGVTARFAYRVVRGGSTNEYVFFTPLEGLESYEQANPVRRGMGDTDAADWFARLRECIDDVRLDTLRVRTELSIPVAEGRTRRLARLRMVDTRPGRGQDYERWVADTWVPAMRDADMNGVIHFQNAFGVGQPTWTRLTFYDTWADLEGHPVRRHVGPEAFTEVLGTNGEMTYGPKVRILEFLPDLSVVATAGQ